MKKIEKFLRIFLYVIFYHVNLNLEDKNIEVLHPNNLIKQDVLQLVLKLD